jgi:aryl-alcohol dehydrogenase-like predicted oxidoreductase
MQSCGQAVHPYDEESTATIHLAIELGCTFLDTAEVYGPFTNEELLGRSLKGRRDQVTIATKFGFALTGNERHGLNSRPDHIKEVVDADLAAPEPEARLQDNRRLSARLSRRLPIGVP